MKQFTSKFATLTLCLSLVGVAIALSACKTPQLEPGGVYTTVTTNGVTVAVSGDVALFTVDTAFGFAYDALDAAFLFEKQNRDVLFKLSPKIKATLDNIRPDAVKARNDFFTIRAAYIAHPTPAGLTGLEAALGKMQQLLATANAALLTTTSINQY
jgi:hypothetical protein